MTTGQGKRRTHYDILGIDKVADVASVRAAFKRRVLACHPDKLPVNASDDERIAACTEFRLVQEAAKVLNDPILRARADAALLGHLVQSCGRVSDRYAWSDFDRRDGDDESVVMECRCGGEYVIISASPPPPGETFHAECDSCSLLVEVVA
jgi:curved DNA-binding protein CbpA